jgi:acyl-CoA thioester hydrolase
MALTPSTFVAQVQQRVIYGDTDQMGVVYYANYLRFFELGRLEYFRLRGGRVADLEAAGFALPVAEVQAQYRAPARYEDLVLVKAWVAELRRASLRFDYQLHRESDGALLCTGMTVHACITRDGRPVRLPEGLTRLLVDATAP